MKLHSLLHLPAIALACNVGYDTLLDGRCFLTILDNSFYYYDEEKSFCANNDTTLPMITSQEESDQLHAALENKGLDKTSFWLGLECDGEKLVWADGTEANYTNFDHPFTCNVNTKSKRFCVYAGPKMIWSVVDTGYQMMFHVCEERRESGVCGKFDVFEEGNSQNTCYELHKTPTTWNDAAAQCSASHSSLSVIHDQALNEFIRSTAIANGLIDGMHIGLREHKGNYTWEDGSVEDFEKFIPSFPNDLYGECVAMETQFLGGQWMNVECDIVKLPYVCTKPASRPADPQQPPGCPEKTLYAPGEDIYSPSYPSAPGASACEYLLLDPNPNTKAEVEITFFESNFCCDTLTIYDDIFGTAVLTTISGYHPDPIRVVANTYAMRLVWNATSGSNVRGFHTKMIE